MNRVLKWTGLGLLVVALGVAGLVVFAPVDRLRQPIEAAVREATGRSFHIHGPVSLTFSSGIGLDLGAVTLADAPGSASAAMVTASDATLDVDLLPLLTGEVKPTALILSGAEIHFTRDAAGEANWSFGEKGKANDPLSAIAFGDVRLINSRIVIAADGDQRELNFVDARLRWAADAANLNLSGTIAFRSERFEVDGLIETPRALFEGGVVPLRLAFSSSLAEGSLDGDADIAGDSFEGGITISAPSARRLAAFFGATIPGDRGFGEMSLAAAMRAMPGEAHFRDIKFTLDDTTGGGDLGIKLNGARLAFAGSVSADSFDLATYFDQPPAGEAVGWSDAPLDVSGLREVDANLAVRLRSASFAGLKIADATGTFTLAGGRAQLDLGSAMLNAGMGRARLRVDAGTAKPSYALALTLTDFDAQSFFTDTIASGALTGRGTLTLALSGQGTTRREIVGALSGNLEMELVGGALDGVDLVAIARTVGGPDALDGASADDATNLSALSAAFTINGGMATTRTLKLTGPSLTLSGHGTIGLAARALRLRFAPQAGATGPLALPFSVTGPWASPTYRADWRALKEMVRAGTIALDALQDIAPARRAWLMVLIALDAPFPEPPLVAGVTEPQ